MDPESCFTNWATADTASERTQAMRDYNAWIARGGHPAEIRVWSDRVFGVPVAAKVLRLGRTKMACRLTYGSVTWTASLHPARLVDAR